MLISGTWLGAARYYASNFEIFKKIVNSFDPDDSAAIKQCQQILLKPEIAGQLAYITSHYLQIKYSITKLEENGLPLTESLKVIEDLDDNLPIGGDVAKEVKQKLKAVLSKNEGYKTLSTISKILAGNEATFVSDIEQKLSPVEVANFKFAPVTTCDVERSFSVYNTFLADNRRSFNFENLKKVFVIRCNASL